MHTLVDFITHVKGIEYVLSLLFIGGFLLLWEALKPRPFRTVVTATRADLAHVRETLGYREAIRTLGKMTAAPFIGLAYIIILPVGFVAVLAFETVNLALKAVSGVMTLAGKSVAFEWRPMEAYFSGKKKKSEKNDTAR